MNTHLNILHLFENTENDKVNAVSRTRYNHLINELMKQRITDYTIIAGYFDDKNTKQAIHKGHRQIVEVAKLKRHPNCIICEDDIMFSHPNSYKYFLSQIPESYDLFCGLVLSAEMKGNRVMNGASGIMTLYSIHSRFYDFFLSMDINNHVDRECGLTAFKHEYLVCQPMVVEQRGGHSYNLNRTMYYTEYLRDTKLYGMD